LLVLGVPGRVFRVQGLEIPSPIQSPGAVSYSSPASTKILLRTSAASFGQAIITLDPVSEPAQHNHKAS
jgi:hypothetical protein